MVRVKSRGQGESGVEDFKPQQCSGGDPSLTPWPPFLLPRLGVWRALQAEPQQDEGCNYSRRCHSNRCPRSGYREEVDGSVWGEMTPLRAGKGGRSW